MDFYNVPIVKTIRNRNTGKSPRSCSKYSHWYYLLLIWGGAKVSSIAIELLCSRRTTRPKYNPLCIFVYHLISSWTCSGCFVTVIIRTLQAIEKVNSDHRFEEGFQYVLIREDRYEDMLDIYICHFCPDEVVFRAVRGIVDQELREFTRAALQQYLSIALVSRKTGNHRRLNDQSG